MNSPINYKYILNFKDTFLVNEDIIDKLNQTALNISEISNRILFTTTKTKTYTKANKIPAENRVISLLNLLTESNKINIFNKILDLDLDEDVLDKCIVNFHKKVCLEYHFFANYIFLIKKIISSGAYNFDKNLFWKLFINKVQDEFEKISEIDDIDNALFSGNLILIFYLCKERLLSLSIIKNIFDTCKQYIESKNTLVNILFSTLDFIPLDNKYNELLVIHINDLLKMSIPFRLKFKLEELLSKIDLELKSNRNKLNSKNPQNQKLDDYIELKSNRNKPNSKNPQNQKLDDYIELILNEYKIKNCKDSLTNQISKIENFRKSYFFKLFLIKIIKLDLENKQFTSLLKFIYQKKYKPNNYKNILSQISKFIKKTNNDTYKKNLSIIISF